MTETEVDALIDGYERLLEHAAKVALLVLETRKETYRPSDPSGLEITLDHGTVWGRYYTHSGNYDFIHNVEFPTSFLWSENAEIVARTLETMDTERIKREQAEANRVAEQERQERARYERLKAKYGWLQ